MTLFEHHTHPHQPRNVNALHEAERTGINQWLAVGITKAFGSIWAFYVLIAWMLLWIALASAGFWLFKADPYPFPFLLFCSNLIQLWALPVLAVGQRVLSRHQELQADETYATTTKIYHDIEEIKAHLAAQDVALTKQTAFLSKR